MNENKNLTTRELVLVGLMIALVYLAGSIIRVPSVGGFVHIGDCMVFLSVVVLGKKKGAVASSFGMLLVDVLGGYYLWAPFTFITNDHEYSTYYKCSKISNSVISLIFHNI